MTTTSVKDVGSVMNLGSGTTNPSVKAMDDSFKNVLNTQTGKDRTAEQPGAGRQPDKSAKADEPAKPGDDLRAKDTQDRSAVSVKEKKPVEPEQAEAAAPEEMSEEELEAAMEIIASAVVELVQQTADAFDMPVEEVQELVTELDLQPAALLEPENLSNLLLKAGGAEDSLALLTDEELYTKFQNLMAQGREAAVEVGEQLQVPPEKMEQILTVASESGGAPVPVEAGQEAAEIQPTIEVAVHAEMPEESPKELPEKSPEPERPKEAAKPEQQSKVQGAEVQEAETVQTTAAKEKQPAEDGAAEQRQSGRGRHEQGRADANPFLQELRNGQFQPQTEDVQETAGAWDNGARDIMRQIMDYMRVSVKPDISNLEMQLHPASLGTLQIQVAAKGGVLTANFITQNEAVKAALESQMIQLRENFEQQGVKVEAIEVTVQTHQFEENLEQGRDRQPQESGGRRGRSRRISLNGIEGMDSPEGMSEEERLTAAMMAANGNTVDFTA